MATKQYSIGYEEGFQNGWNAAVDAKPEQPAQQALDKKAENARELGLDYAPIQCPICKAEDSPYPKCGCVTYVEQPAQQQEPVGYVAENGVVDWNVCAPPIMTDLYTSPQTAQPSKPWVGLTDEERNRIWSSYRVSFVAIEHIEAKLREKNT